MSLNQCPFQHTKYVVLHIDFKVFISETLQTVTHRENRQTAGERKSLDEIPGGVNTAEL